MKGSEILMVLLLNIVLTVYPLRAQFSVDYTADFVSNLKGGIRTGSGYLGLLELKYTSGTSDLKLWKNGEIHLHGLFSHGKSVSQLLTGDCQVLSNIEAGYYPGFFEFWFSQKFGQFEFTLGQHDLNSVFVLSDHSATLLNSSFGIISSLPLNLPVPIFPIASSGLLISYQAAPKWIIRAGIYDGDPGNVETNKYNLEMKISGKEGALTILEIEKQLSIWNQATIKTGGYFHSGGFLNLDSLAQLHQGNYGLYLVVDQELWRRIGSDGGLSAFFQLGLAPSYFNMVKRYQGIGLSWKGVFKKDDSDNLSFGIASSVFSPYQNLNASENKAMTETSLELTYQIWMKSYFMLQPDFQLLINPGGTNMLPNAWVVTLRFQVLAHEMLQKRESKKPKPVAF